jgi:phage repressor protein C with HTH and peptisase S24 domain
MLGTGVLTFTLGCAVSVRAQQEMKDEGKKAPPYQQAKLEQAKLEQTKLEQTQPGQRLQYAYNSGVGLIPNDRFRAHFGREHKFHLSPAAYGKDRRFEYGGYSFGFVDEWPVNWRPAEDLFVLQIDGGYYLCNRTYPGVNIPLNIAP